MVNVLLTFVLSLFPCEINGEVFRERCNVRETLLVHIFTPNTLNGQQGWPSFRSYMNDISRCQDNSIPNLISTDERLWLSYGYQGNFPGELCHFAIHVTWCKNIILYVQLFLFMFALDSIFDHILNSPYLFYSNLISCAHIFLFITCLWGLLELSF